MIAAKTEVLNHLLFHKALVDEDDDGSRIDGYMHLVEEVDSNLHMHLSDPMDKSLAIALELVLQEHFDPWSVDLVQFASMYMERIRNEKDVDFVVAGRLILMAWSVLALKSGNLLTRTESVQECDNYFADWDVMGDIYCDPTDIDFTSAVLDTRGQPMEEKIRHREDRHVTLIEMIDAFDEARREAERHMELNDRRREARKAREHISIDDKLHKENQLEDIHLTWQRLCASGQDRMRLASLLKNDVEDLVTVFISLLFLAKDHKIRLTQEGFPYGDIMITNLVPAGQRVIEVPLVTAEDAPEMHVENLAVM